MTLQAKSEVRSKFFDVGRGTTGNGKPVYRAGRLIECRNRCSVARDHRRHSRQAVGVGIKQMLNGIPGPERRFGSRPFGSRVTFEIEAKRYRFR